MIWSGSKKSSGVADFVMEEWISDVNGQFEFQSDGSHLKVYSTHYPVKTNPAIHNNKKNWFCLESAIACL